MLFVEQCHNSSRRRRRRRPEGGLLSTYEITTADIITSVNKS